MATGKQRREWFEEAWNGFIKASISDLEAAIRYLITKIDFAQSDIVELREEKKKLNDLLESSRKKKIEGEVIDDLEEELSDLQLAIKVHLENAALYKRRADAAALMLNWKVLNGVNEDPDKGDVFTRQKDNVGAPTLVMINRAKKIIQVTHDHKPESIDGQGSLVELLDRPVSWIDTTLRAFRDKGHPIHRERANPQSLADALEEAISNIQ